MRGHEIRAISLANSDHVLSFVNAIYSTSIVKADTMLNNKIDVPDMLLRDF